MLVLELQQAVKTIGQHPYEMLKDMTSIDVRTCAGFLTAIYSIPVACHAR